jgi:hypothetical protein
LRVRFEGTVPCVRNNDWMTHVEDLEFSFSTLGKRMIVKLFLCNHPATELIVLAVRMVSSPQPFVSNRRKAFTGQRAATAFSFVQPPSICVLC